VPTELLSSQTFKPEDVDFISISDLEFQSRVKNITGYDWITFLNADGSGNAKITALLFLANEIDSLDDDFNFVNRSVGISKSELPSRLNATDNSKGNLMELTRRVKEMENLFLEKNLNSAEIRINRLIVIESFFNKYSLPEGGVTNENITALFAELLGLTVDDYPRLVSLIIVNYNLFLAE